MGVWYRIEARFPKWLPTLALFSITWIWGGTFVWMKSGLEAANRVLGPRHDMAGLAVFMALRFSIAALVVLALSKTARNAASRGAWVDGFWLGALLLAGFGLQMYGLIDVSPAVSAFLTSLYVLFTALLSTMLARKRLRWPLAVGAMLATIGAGIVRGRPDLTFDTAEILTIASALVFAVHILLTDKVTRRAEPLAITFTSFTWVAVGSIVAAAILLARHDAPPLATVIELVRDRDFLVPLALTTILATVVAITLMNIFQREIDPVRAAILYAFEPIWATIAGLFAGMDRWTNWLWIGGAILLAGNLVAEIDGRRPERERNAER